MQLAQTQIAASLLLLLAAASGCSKQPPSVDAPDVTAPEVTAPEVTSRKDTLPQIDWIDLTKNGLSRLDEHDRAIVVIYADWDIACVVSLRKFEVPATLLTFEEHHCQPFKYNIIDEDANEALKQRFPEWTKAVGRVLLLEKGKFLAELKFENVEQELQTRYNKN